MLTYDSEIFWPCTYVYEFERCRSSVFITQIDMEAHKHGCTASQQCHVQCHSSYQKQSTSPPRHCTLHNKTTTLNKNTNTTCTHQSLTFPCRSSVQRVLLLLLFHSTVPVFTRHDPQYMRPHLTPIYQKDSSVLEDRLLPWKSTLLNSWTWQMESTSRKEQTERETSGRMKRELTRASHFHYECDSTRKQKLASTSRTRSQTHSSLIGGEWSIRKTKKPKEKEKEKRK